MKKALLLGLSFALAISVQAQQAPANKTAAAITETVSGPQIAFAQSKFDFGTVVSGDIVEHVFTFTNSGTEPLVLSNVQTTCGCTVPQWPKEPILPGNSGEIKATFNTTGKGGQQNKVITIISNAKEGNTQVSLIGNVTVKSQASGQTKPTGHEGHSH